MPPPFGATWGTLHDRCDELPEEATLITALSDQAIPYHRRSGVTDHH